MFGNSRFWSKTTLHLGLLILAAFLSMGSPKKGLRKLGRGMKRAGKRMKKSRLKRGRRFRRKARFRRRARFRRKARFRNRRVRRKRRITRRRHRRHTKRNRVRNRRRNRRHARRDRRRDNRNRTRDNRHVRRDYTGCPGGSVRYGNRCACPSGTTWSSADFACINSAVASGGCSGGAVRSGNSCVCPQGTKWNGSTRVCEKAKLANGCPGGALRRGNSCVCPQATKWNRSTRVCEKAKLANGCPGGALRRGNSCVCPQGTDWNRSTRLCEQATAAKKCPSGQRWDDQQRRCEPEKKKPADANHGPFTGRGGIVRTTSKGDKCRPWHFPGKSISFETCEYKSGGSGFYDIGNTGGTTLNLSWEIHFRNGKTSKGASWKTLAGHSHKASCFNCAQKNGGGVTGVTFLRIKPH